MISPSRFTCAFPLLSVVLGTCPDITHIRIKNAGGFCCSCPSLACPAHTNVVLARGKRSSASPAPSELLLWWERPGAPCSLCSYGIAALKFSVFSSLRAHPACSSTEFPPRDQAWVCFWVKPHKIQCGRHPSLCGSPGVTISFSCFTDQSCIALCIFSTSTHDLSPDLSLTDGAACPIRQIRQIISI